ncbi:NPCBM/NEW2 domain-containing protein [Actinophytocola gossypii]|uniref:NPCBM/NEW2 domain-containing protein n=1 Tax=Actinophytocola gossypii TaxID=2812003 RepID=A0ABT2J9J2_9PSEU|nr:NPCBM/NEW2 domain-containing protein [Actinophytocola gossypii]MCT2584533.1 NPCBM/NEW2 domain-containing protein [Actinophytocola gossypii]
MSKRTERARLVLAGLLLVAVLPAGAGTVEATGRAAPAVTVTAPERIAQELTGWDVAFDSIGGRPSPPAPAHVGSVDAEIALPETVRDVRVVPDGPGTFTATTPTSWDTLAAGSRVSVNWRWTAPLRVEDAPDELGLRVLVRYVDTAGEHVVAGRDAVATPPPAAPAHDAYVSDLPLSFAVNGYGPVERDRNNGELDPRDGGPIRLDGVTYAKGLGFNARGVAGVHLGGRCGRFSAQVGIDDAKRGGGSVVFRVFGDGRVLFDSGRMTGGTASKPVGVDVSGVRTLKLVADPTGDGQGNDWANWANAHVACGGPAPAEYRLRNVRSGLCLDVTASSTTPGANIEQWTCNGGANQRFRLSENANSIKFSAVHSGLCVGVAGSVPTDGGNVIQWTCGPSVSQNWHAVTVGQGGYQLRNANSGKCLEVHQASTTAGANVQQWTCAGRLHQFWVLERVG